LNELKPNNALGIDYQQNYIRNKIVKDALYDLTQDTYEKTRREKFQMIILIEKL